MPWKESMTMDEKLKFVYGLLGEQISRRCEECGITRVTSHKIIDRYKESGLETFNDRSRKLSRHRTACLFKSNNPLLTVK
jgi:putative transposase